MGTPIAERLIHAGYPVAVFNRRSARMQNLVDLGATALTSVGEALRAGTTCVTVLADDDAVEAVLLREGGILDGARAGTTLIDMSTISIAASQRIAHRADQSGVDYLRAPVSGNPDVVRAGNLTVILSGPEHPKHRASDILRAIAGTVRDVGEYEESRAIKLGLQVMIAGTAQLLAEALLLTERAGVKREIFLDVLGASAAASPFVKYKTAPLLADDFDATFTTSMLVKDLRLVQGLAVGVAAPVPITKHVAALTDNAVAAGYGDRDFMALYLALCGRGAVADTTTQTQNA